MPSEIFLKRIVMVMTMAAAPGPFALAQAFPPGFAVEEVVSGLANPTAIAFAPDGRMFIAEQRGTVRVFENGVLHPDFFIDLRAEVAGAGFRGLLGIALDPQFATNRRVYLAYTADPTPGEPDEPDNVPTLSRVTRYAGTIVSNGNIADPSTRTVLIGAQPSQGIPACWAHTVDSLAFGPDGQLFVSAGDGGHYEFADGGGNDPQCFQPPLFGSDQDLGAFRAQYLGSLAGKVLRIDPETGAGLADNPFFNSDPFSIQSRIWVRGLRNPFQISVKPNTNSQSPGVLYIGDVGWNSYEEINISKIGGENFGWPCFEGPTPAPQYPNMNPPSNGCGTIGNTVPPTLHWHYTNPAQSFPLGFLGRCAIGGAFYTGTSYPLAYHNAYFYADYYWGWINVLKTDANDQYVNAFNFADGISWMVDFAVDPISGDLFYVTVFDSRIWRITYSGPGTGDVNGDAVVNVQDLFAIINAWGPCAGGPQKCPADINGDGTVNVQELLLVINNWG